MTGDTDPSDDPTDGGRRRLDPAPDPHPEQVEVMLLGTYHMDDPGLDEYNLDVDDVLAADRQAELRAMVDRLADWGPDLVAVERPYDRADELNDRYREYRDGDRRFDREESFPAPHPDREEPATECRSEVVQVGFRLAARLDHDRVAAVDERPAPPESDPFADRDVDPERKTAAPLPDPEAFLEREAELLANSTVGEYHAHLNEPGAYRFNHELLFDRCLRTAGDAAGSPMALARWYDRNLRVVHHLWRTMHPGDDRLLLLFGAGHRRVLRHLLTEAPTFHPTSPLSVLPAPPT